MANDFEEVVDQFHRIVAEIKSSPRQLLDPAQVDVARSIAISSANRTTSQKELAKGLGEEIVQGKQLQLIDKRRSLEAKLQTNLSERAQENISNELIAVEEMLSSNIQLLESIDEQVIARGQAIGQLATLNEFEQRILEIDLERAELQANSRKMTWEQIKLQGDRLDQMKTERLIQEGLFAEREKTAALSELATQQQELFGINTVAINNRIGELTPLLNSTAGRLTIIAAGMKVLLTPVIAHMKELRNLGLTWSQTMEASADTIRSTMDRGLVRGLLTMRDTAEVTAAMRADFADITFQSPELVALGGELVTAFKLSGGEAADLLEVLAKVGGLTDVAQTDILHMAQAFGKVNDIRPDALLRAAARHASVFARFGEDGAQAFFRSVTAAERLGIELASIEGSADRFLDIDTFFQDVSKLRTLGIDIVDPFGLAQIAESGTPAELVAELQRQLSGVDLTTLGRTRRQALAGAIGMDEAELSRLIQGPSVAGIEGVTPGQVEELGGFAEGMGGAVDAMGAAVEGLGGIASILSNIVLQLALLNALSAGGGGVASKVLSLGKRALATGISLGGTALGAIGSAATAGAGASLLATGAVAAGGLALGGFAGEQINQATGMRSFESNRRDAEATRRSAESGRAADARLARTQARTAAAHTFAAQTPGATSEDIRRALQGVVVETHVDGRNMTNALARSRGEAR